MPSGACVVRYAGKRGTVWRIKYADAGGKQVQETIGAERDGVTRSQAQAALRERLVRVEQRGYRRPKALTFGEWAGTWLEEGKARRGWKPRTILAYQNTVEQHLAPVFGATRLESIRPRDVAGYVRQVMSEPHERFGRPLSAKFVNLHLNVLHAIFKAAIAEELVQTNPVASVERPKVQRRRWRILQPAEVGRVAAGFTDERARRVFLTLMLTGLRRFELQALRWQDVNMLDATLRVVESKSEEGERLIAVPRSSPASWRRTSRGAPTGPGPTTFSPIRRAARGSSTSSTPASSGPRCERQVSRSTSDRSTTPATRP